MIKNVEELVAKYLKLEAMLSIGNKPETKINKKGE